jgi:DNA-binding NarL/FixJ family response regulator
MSHHQTLILVVAGHSLLRHGILFLLNKLSWATICGETYKAATARQICVEQRPDLIVLDMELGDEESLNLLRDFSRLHPTAKTLALSEREDAKWVQRVFKAGAKGFVSKRDHEDDMHTGLSWLCFNKERYVGRRLSHFLLQEFLGADDSSSDPHEKVTSLSDRELDVFRLIGEGQNTKSIAENLSRSTKTIETHRHRIKGKLGLSSGDEVNRLAFEWVLAGKSKAS